jgi:group I intron endonuclease
MTGKTGIYIIAGANGISYIGSTVNFQQRWRGHRSKLRRGVHDNPHLQHAWNKYGEGSFEFGVLEYLEDPKELHLAEQFWMDMYREEGRDLYNMGLCATCAMRGRPLDPGHRRRISEALIGHDVSEQTRHKIRNAATGRAPSRMTRSKISRALKGKKKPPRSAEHCCNMASAKAKPYPAFYNEYTDEIIPAGVNLKAMCHEWNLDPSNMGRLKRGQRQRHKGWVLLEAVLDTMDRSAA